MKNQRGITLIALVITIIVLLILAGVTISMVVGDNGILTKADKSKTNTERAKIVELARVDVVGQQGENLNSRLRKSELIDILNKYFTNVSEIENSSNILEETVTSKEEYGVYDIKVSEIYNNKFLDDESEVLPQECNITINCVDNSEKVLKQINLKFGKGEDYTLTDIVPSSIDLEGGHYIISDQVNETRIAEKDEIITVLYEIDNIGGGDDGKASDGVIDKNQIILYFYSSNTAYGTVSQSYITITKKNDSSENSNYFDESVSIVASTTTLVRTYFSSWTIGNKTLSTNNILDYNILNNQDFAFGNTYDIIANFSRTGTGGDGGGSAG